MNAGGGVSRRAVLLGASAAVVGLAGAGVAGIESGVVPGKSRLQRLVGQDGPRGTIPDVSPGLLVSGSFVSKHRLGHTCGWTIAYPQHQPEHLPVVLVLHGKGGTHSSAFGRELGLDRFLRAGGHQFAIASIDGGDTYWHNRLSGEDAGAMVTNELLPLLAEQDLDVRRIGLLGWSMGGFGSLWLSGVLGAQRVAAVAVESPAIWHSAGQSAPGAFDDEADFRAHDVFTHTAALAKVPLRIDCGTGDGFYPAARDYADLLRADRLREDPTRISALTGSFEAGAHDFDYWRRMAPAQLEFLAQHLV